MLMHLGCPVLPAANRADRLIAVPAPEQIRVPPSAPARLVVLASGTGSLLQALLDAPLPDARTHINIAKKRARVENRGGKLNKAEKAVVVVAPGAKKPKNKAAPVVEDTSWKRRGSFFVFAK